MYIFRKTYNFFLHKKRLIRTVIWRRLFGNLGLESRILGRIAVYSPENVYIGERCTVNEGCILNGRAKLIIGNDCHLSPCVIINTGSLDYSKIGIERMHTEDPINIGNGVWLGSGAIINPGVTIGENSVVGAGAVVTKDVPSNVVVVGVPAQIIKQI